MIKREQLAIDIQIQNTLSGDKYFILVGSMPVACIQHSHWEDKWYAVGAPGPRSEMLEQHILFHSPPEAVAWVLTKLREGVPDE